MKQAEFLQIEGSTTVTPMRTDTGQMLGWTVARNGINLERNRGGIRTFKALDSVAAFCAEHDIDGFKVSGV